MEPAAVLWQSLCQVRSLRFTARSATQGGWNGIGSGGVAVEVMGTAVCTFTETGSWEPLGGKSLRFSNVFRWSILGPEAVRLEHLRFGPDHPVYLFDMTPKGMAKWISSSPHVCREDCYAAELEIADRQLCLRWSIVGPKKEETIEYEYGW